jgi:hypothetical protein
MISILQLRAVAGLLFDLVLFERGELLDALPVDRLFGLEFE